MWAALKIQEHALIEWAGWHNINQDMIMTAIDNLDNAMKRKHCNVRVEHWKQYLA